MAWRAPSYTELALLVCQPQAGPLFAELYEADFVTMSTLCRSPFAELYEAGFVGMLTPSRSPLIIDSRAVAPRGRPGQSVFVKEIVHLPNNMTKILGSFGGKPALRLQMYADDAPLLMLSQFDFIQGWGPVLPNSTCCRCSQQFATVCPVMPIDKGGRFDDAYPIVVCLNCLDVALTDCP